MLEAVAPKVDGTVRLKAFGAFPVGTGFAVVVILPRLDCLVVVIVCLGTVSATRFTSAVSFCVSCL